MDCDGPSNRFNPLFQRKMEFVICKGVRKSRKESSVGVVSVLTKKINAETLFQGPFEKYRLSRDLASLMSSVAI